MVKNHSEIISQELGITLKQVENTIQLLTSGATVPFIARYRKEATGCLDEVQIISIRDRYNQLVELDKRRESIINSIQEQNKDMNNIFSQISNQQQNIEPQNNLIQPEVAVEKPTSFEPIQPVIEPQVESNKIEPVIQPAIEELNFDEEIKPVQPFTLDDNQNFNNQNSQILSQSSSPVAIITPKEIPELQPIMPEQEQTKYGTINDMINIIRDSIDRVESNGYIVDSDEP